MTSKGNSRADFERDLISRVFFDAKGKGWRKKWNVFFRAVGAYYLEATIMVGRTKVGTRVDFAFKPMAVDPIRWEICGVIGECEKQPLSFRSFGLANCKSINLESVEVEGPGDVPSTVAIRVVDSLWSAERLLIERVGRCKYADMVRDLPEHVGRGNFASEHLVALLAEGRYIEAESAARAYLLRYEPSSKAFHRVGKSFEQLVLRWVESKIGKLPVRDP